MSEPRRKAIDDLYAVFAPDVVLEAEVEAVLARIVAIDRVEASAEPGALSEHARQSASGEHLFDESCRYCVAAEPGALSDADIAQRFHEAYERLAPSFGYETREASAKPWADVPENNRRLMIAVAGEVRQSLRAEPGALREALDGLPKATCYRFHGQPDEGRGVYGAVWIADVIRVLLSPADAVVALSPSEPRREDS